MVRRSLFVSLLFFALLVLSEAAAVEGAPSRVGRISFLEGSVEIGDVAGEAAREPAAVNYPVVAGTRISLERFARAEIRIGPHALRVEGEAALEFQELDESGVQIQLGRGTVNLALREFFARDEHFLITTPWAIVSLLAPGSYRLEAAPETGLTSITVRSGEALVTSAAGGELLVKGGRQVTASASGLVEYDGAPAYGDDFDRWTAQREAEEPAGDAGRYVSPYVTGYEELNRYGSWGSDPMYGPLWIPSGTYAWWAPYQYGSWTWVQPWGWTWVDQAPWAFSTFRLGQWVFIGGRWCWAPGHYLPRPPLAAFVPFRPGQMIFTTPFLFHGKPAVDFMPLAPRHGAGVTRPFHHGQGLTQGLGRPPQAVHQVQPGTARVPPGVPSPSPAHAGPRHLPPMPLSPRTLAAPPRSVAPWTAPAAAVQVPRALAVPGAGAAQVDVRVQRSQVLRHGAPYALPGWSGGQRAGPGLTVAPAPPAQGGVGPRRAFRDPPAVQQGVNRMPGVFAPAVTPASGFGGLRSSGGRR